MPSFSPLPSLPTDFSVNAASTADSEAQETVRQPDEMEEPIASTALPAGK